VRWRLAVDYATHAHTRRAGVFTTRELLLEGRRPAPSERARSRWELCVVAPVEATPKTSERAEPCTARSVPSSVPAPDMRARACAASGIGAESHSSPSPCGRGGGGLGGCDGAPPSLARARTHARAATPWSLRGTPARLFESRCVRPGWPPRRCSQPSAAACPSSRWWPASPRRAMIPRDGRPCAPARRAVAARGHHASRPSLASRAPHTRRLLGEVARERVLQLAKDERPRMSGPAFESGDIGTRRADDARVERGIRGAALASPRASRCSRARATRCPSARAYRTAPRRLV
jgi:hypothetical protein